MRWSSSPIITVIIIIIRRRVKIRSKRLKKTLRSCGASKASHEGWSKYQTAEIRANNSITAQRRPIKASWIKR